VAAELTVLTPLLLMMLMFVVLCGRLAGTRLRLDDVAHQAARAASAARTVAGAQSDAQSTAHAALAAAGISCRTLRVTVDTAGLQPGSTVTATVSCTVGLGDLSLLAVPGSKQLAASFTSPVDVYRQAG
jgi:Flp pilus assembly protein TadG